MLLFGVFVQLNFAENEFSQRSLLYTSKQIRKSDYSRVVGQIQRGSCPIVQLPPPAARAKPFPPATHFLLLRSESGPIVHQNSSFQWLFLKKKIKSCRKPSKQMLWLVVTADCVWQDGLMGSHSDRRFQRAAPACQSAEAAAGVHKGAHAAAILWDSTHCLDIFVQLYFPPAQNKKEKLFTVLNDCARVELACVRGSRDFDVSTLGFPGVNI